ncbi:MAG: PD-(D/E)XK nuclease family protein [Cyanobacteria bacterium P01_A01_bin.105]
MPTPSLTQTHLTLLETCPRKFQHIFISGVSPPPDPDLQASATWGNQFHLLMQQQALSLPITVMEPVDEAMTTCLRQLRQVSPELFEAPPGWQHHSETQRTLAFNGYLLTVIYDLLRLGAAQAQIVDWKTYQQTPKREWIENDWQTRLYLFVLAETSGLPPDQLSMTYWFVRGKNADSPAPERHRFGYSLVQHEQTRTDLQRLTAGLTQLMESGTDFPQIDAAAGKCDRCPFVHRCGRSEAALQAGVPVALDLDIDTFSEVPL